MRLSVEEPKAPTAEAMASEEGQGEASSSMRAAAPESARSSVELGGGSVVDAKIRIGEETVHANSSGHAGTRVSCAVHRNSDDEERWTWRLPRPGQGLAPPDTP